MSSHPSAESDLKTIARILAPYIAEYLPRESGIGSDAEQDHDDDKVRADGLLAEGRSKSAIMRMLWQEGWERGRIAKALGTSYQFVYNQTANIERAS
jgi:hypothetical protein